MTRTIISRIMVVHGAGSARTCNPNSPPHSAARTKDHTHMTQLLNTPPLEKLRVACEDMYISMLWITPGQPEKTAIRDDYRRLCADPKIDIHARCRIVHAMMGQALRWAEVSAQRAAAILAEQGDQS